MGEMRRALLPLLLLSLPARPDALPMWEIHGASNTIHILGSIHFLRPADTLPRAIIAAYDEANVVVMEIDLDNLDPVAAAATMQELAIDPKGRTLDVLLGDVAAVRALDGRPHSHAAAARATRLRCRLGRGATAPETRTARPQGSARS